MSVTLSANQEKILSGNNNVAFCMTHPVGETKTQQTNPQDQKPKVETQEK